jgi:hypothetical protein
MGDDVSPPSKLAIARALLRIRVRAGAVGV